MQNLEISTSPNYVLAKLAYAAALAGIGIAILTGCAPTEPDPYACPEFHRNDTVKVISGPYKDSVGVVVGVSRPGPSCNQGYNVFINNQPDFERDLSGALIKLWEGKK
jgi:hypothetical protein